MKKFKFVLLSLFYGVCAIGDVVILAFGCWCIHGALFPSIAGLVGLFLVLTGAYLIRTLACCWYVDYKQYKKKVKRKKVIL